MYNLTSSVAGPTGPAPEDPTTRWRTHSRTFVSVRIISENTQLNVDFNTVLTAVEQKYEDIHRGISPLLFNGINLNIRMNTILYKTKLEVKIENVDINNTLNQAYRYILVVHCGPWLPGTSAGSLHCLHVLSIRDTVITAVNSHGGEDSIVTVPEEKIHILT